MSDAHATLGRSSVDESPGSGEDEIVEPEQGNGIVPAIRRWEKTNRFPRDARPPLT